MNCLAPVLSPGRGGSTDARPTRWYKSAPTGGFTCRGCPAIRSCHRAGQSGQHAPVAPEGGAVIPGGQQITIGAGVPGLAAGTYTLMPSTYALLPGAFRVEVNGLAGQGSTSSAQQMRNEFLDHRRGAVGGQYRAAQQFVQPSHPDPREMCCVATPNTTKPATPSSPWRDAARSGVPRALLPVDAKTLKLNLTKGTADQAFSFQRHRQVRASERGYGGTVAVVASNGTALEVVAEGRGATGRLRGRNPNAESSMR